MPPQKHFQQGAVCCAWARSTVEHLAQVYFQTSFLVRAEQTALLSYAGLPGSQGRLMFQSFQARRCQVQLQLPVLWSRSTGAFQLA